MLLWNPNLPRSSSTHSDTTIGATLSFVSLSITLPSFASISNAIPKLEISSALGLLITLRNKKSATALLISSSGFTFAIVGSHGPRMAVISALGSTGVGAGGAAGGACVLVASGDACLLCCLTAGGFPLTGEAFAAGFLGNAKFACLSFALLAESAHGGGSLYRFGFRLRFSTLGDTDGIDLLSAPEIA